MIKEKKTANVFLKSDASDLKNCHSQKIKHHLFRTPLLGKVEPFNKQGRKVDVNSHRDVTIQPATENIFSISLR